MKKYSLKSKGANFIKKAFSTVFPLSVRKHLAVWADHQNWLPAHRELPLKMLRDWADKDPDAFHRFLWSNHLVYARWYEERNEFGPENLRPSRRMLFEEMEKCLLQYKIDPARDVKSVFDVGCSSGFLLRFLETNVFTSGTKFEGIDIDVVAVERGKAYLRDHGSKIHLMKADMAELESIMNGSKYDVVLCAATIVYLHESLASEVIRVMLNHCNDLVVIYSIAHPTIDNSQLEHSETRGLDGIFYHNIDAMIKAAGGKIVYRSWGGSTTFEDGQTKYFVFSRPPD